jgi:hypothetical protein
LMTGESKWECVCTLKRRKLTTRRGFEDKRLIVPIDRSFSILQKFFVLLFLWLSMASIAIPTNEQRLAIYIIDIHMAYVVSFFRPLPLGLGWASMIAAYSGSRARWMNRLKWGPALKWHKNTLILTKCLKSSVCPKRYV